MIHGVMTMSDIRAKEQQQRRNWMVIYFVCHSSTYSLSIKDKILSEQRH